jgi:glycosyltransferase involved in cell wall biosynthesis
MDFCWIGDGEMKQKIIKIAEQKHITNFTLKKSMTHTQLAKEMNDSDIFYFPSIHEGLPKVAVEAMATGLPAILFDTYKPEHVENNISGFIVSSDQESWDKLKLLSTDTELRTKMSREAAARAQLFSWKTVCKQWETFLIKNV